jgi:hypothetical protein
MVSISLIGEQPIPNLLPIRDQMPNEVVLVSTDRTQEAAERLERLLPDGCTAIPCHASAYDIQAIVSALRTLIKKRGWKPADMLFNLTGGTKAMALAAYSVAMTHRAPFLYLQSEGRKTRLYRYEFGGNDIPCLASNELLPGLITIDDYIRAYADSYQNVGFSQKDGGLFEQAVYEALIPPIVDEIVAGVKLAEALEIDLVVRCENQVGIIEAKTGGQARKKGGIDQLNTAGGREYLGIYTRKMLVLDRIWGKDQSNLKALAQARGIEVIELPSYAVSGKFSSQDVGLLRSAVCKQLGRESAI